MTEKLNKDFVVLENGIKQLITDNNISVLDAFITLLIVNKPIAEAILNQLRSAIEDKNIMDGARKEDIYSTKELIKSTEGYIDFSSTIIRVATSD